MNFDIPSEDHQPNTDDDTLLNRDNQTSPPNEGKDDNPDTNSSAYVYTEKPIYKSTDAGELLGMSYNMVRYWARIYKDFLPDAINVEKGSGNLLLSSRDIDVIRNINKYVQAGLPKERIISILADESSKILDKPPIMTNDNFMELFRTEGFQDFMKYYTTNLIEQYQVSLNSKVDAKMDGLIEKINYLIDMNESEPNLPQTVDHDDELKEIYKQLEDKDYAIKKMEESQRQSAQSIEELKAALEEERNKSFLAKLFRKK